MYPTPLEVVEELMAVLALRDADAFTEFFAEDAVFEIPFTPQGEPARIQGRTAIRDVLAQGWAASSAAEIHAIHPLIYTTNHPDTVVVETEVDVTKPGADRVRVRSAVTVIRVHAGEVVLFRDYFDAGRLVAMANG